MPHLQQENPSATANYPRMPMRAPHAKNPRRLPSGRWQGRVTYWDPATGRRRERTAMFATAREAKQWSREQEQRLRTHPVPAAPDQTVAEYLTLWLTTIAARGLAAKTLRDYRQMMAHPMAALGQKPLTQLTAWDIQQLYTTLAQTHSPRTVNYVHTVLKQALADAVDWGLLPTNPAARAKAPRDTRQTTTILTPDEARQLLAATQGQRWHMLWAVMLHTGLRPGEAIAVRWQDLDWNTGTLYVRQTVSGDGARRVLRPTKTPRSTRPIALGPHILASLRAHQHQQALERSAAGDQWTDLDLIFTTHTGRLLSPRNVARAFRQDLRRAGLPTTFHPHCLRHTMASHWLAAGQSIKVISERLGHTSVAFTLQIYAHLLPTQHADAAAAMDAWLFAPSSHDPQTIPTTSERRDPD